MEERQVLGRRPEGLAMVADGELEMIYWFEGFSNYLMCQFLEI
jgi:hypothetical protein